MSPERPKRSGGGALLSALTRSGAEATHRDFAASSYPPAAARSRKKQTAKGKSVLAENELEMCVFDRNHNILWSPQPVVSVGRNSTLAGMHNISLWATLDGNGIPPSTGGALQSRGWTNVEDDDFNPMNWLQTRIAVMTLTFLCSAPKSAWVRWQRPVTKPLPPRMRKPRSVKVARKPVKKSSGKQHEQERQLPLFTDRDQK